MKIYLSRIIASDFVTFLFKSIKFDLCIIVVCFIDNLRAQYHALILYTFMHVNEKYALYALSFNNIQIILLKKSLIILLMCCCKFIVVYGTQMFRDFWGHPLLPIFISMNDYFVDVFIIESQVKMGPNYIPSLLNYRL